MLALLTSFVGAALFLPQKEPTSNYKDHFSLDVEVLSAMESGPLVVKLVLQYRGGKPIDIQPEDPPYHPLDDFHSFPKWTVRKRCRVIEETGGITGGLLFDRLKPGATRSRTYYLHHDYERIPAGRAQLRIEWPVYAPARRITKGGRDELIEGVLLAKPSTTITVNVPPATPDNIRALRQRLERELAACALLPEGLFPYRNLRHEQAQHLAETLRYCPHEQLFPLVPKLIALPDSNLRLIPLIQHVYDASASPQKAHAVFRDYLIGQNPVQATAIFSFWEDLNREASLIFRNLPSLQAFALAPVGFMLDPHSYMLELDFFISHYKAYRRLLPNPEIQRMKQAPNIWVKALAWVTFPRLCDRRWVEGLKADLRRLNRPLPTAEFQRMLGQLDSPRFPVRERAAAALLQVGDGAAPALREALKRPLGLELRRRIERVLEEIDRGRFDPLRYETLAYLAGKDTPEARAVLQTLAQGIPQAQLTKEAAFALKQPKEYLFKRAETPRQQPLKFEEMPPEGKK